MTVEEKVEVIITVLDEVRRGGHEGTAEEVSPLLQAHAPQLTLTTEEVPAIIAVLAARADEVTPSLSADLAHIKRLIGRHGREELKRIIDVL